MNYRCERCRQFMADLKSDLVCVGSFKPAAFGAIIPGPKDSIKCKCGYLNIFVERSAVKLFQGRQVAAG